MEWGGEGSGIERKGGQLDLSTSRKGLHPTRPETDCPPRPRKSFELHSFVVYSGGWSRVFLYWLYRTHNGSTPNRWRSKPHTLRGALGRLTQAHTFDRLRQKHFLFPPRIPFHASFSGEVVLVAALGQPGGRPEGPEQSGEKHGPAGRQHFLASGRGRQIAGKGTRQG